MHMDLTVEVPTIKENTMAKGFKVDYNDYDTLEEAVKYASKQAARKWDTYTVWQAVKTVEPSPDTLPKVVVSDFVAS